MGHSQPSLTPAQQRPILHCVGRHVPRHAQFFEGNFEEAFSLLKSDLLAQQLWARIAYPWPDYSTFHQHIRDQIEREQQLAAAVIKRYISKDFRRRRGTLEHSFDGSSLLKALEAGCKPFPLMDLPRSLRFQVYRRFIWTGSRFNTFIRPLSIRKLSATSSQLRAEISELFYRENQFRIYLREPDCIAQLQRSIAAVGAVNLQYLHNACITIHWRGQDEFDFVELVDCPWVGLHVELSTAIKYDRMDNQRLRIRSKALTALVKQRILEGKWKGSGFVELLLEETDALREALYGVVEFEDGEREVPAPW